MRESRPRRRSIEPVSSPGAVYDRRVAGKGETLDIVPRLLITGPRVGGSSQDGIRSVIDFGEAA
jgi:hypothetical protein